MFRPLHQLVPLTIIFAIAVTAFVVGRMYLVPETFGEYGHYRADAVGEVASQEIAYAGYQVCYDCHDDIYDEKMESNHSGVSCEVCHGPAAAHTEAPDEVTPDIPHGRSDCVLCHGYNPSRPSGFPQILPELHNTGKPCMVCHNPHAPVLDHAPTECSACHRKISSQKMVSHHALLECSQCHTVAEGHRTNPASVRADKPESKDVCGSCHDKGAESSRGIPRVDVETHNARYLCWDCHYPHQPEVVR